MTDLPPDLPDDIRRAALADPAVRAAVAFNDTFVPVSGIDYGWAVKHAKEIYATADAAFKQTDDKAAALFNYLGGGAGLVALGSAAGTAVGQLSPYVALAALPAIIAAALSLVFAAIARKPFEFAYPPSTASAARRMKHYADAALAEASLLGTWELATTMVQHSGDRKAAWLSTAVWVMVAAVSLLALPLITAVAIRFA